MKLIDTLLTIESMQKCYEAMLPNSYCSRRDVMVAVKKGLVESVGECLVCDDDGFAVEPERFKEGFVLTQAGKDFLERERSRVEVHQKGRIAMRLAGVKG